MPTLGDRRGGSAPICYTCGWLPCAHPSGINPCFLVIPGSIPAVHWLITTALFGRGVAPPFLLLHLVGLLRLVVNERPFRLHRLLCPHLTDAWLLDVSGSQRGIGASGNSVREAVRFYETSWRGISNHRTWSRERYLVWRPTIQRQHCQLERGSFCNSR